MYCWKSGPFSLAATIAGYATGAWIVAQIGLQRALIITGFFQMWNGLSFLKLSLIAGMTI